MLGRYLDDGDVGPDAFQESKRSASVHHKAVSSAARRGGRLSRHQRMSSESGRDNPVRPCAHNLLFLPARLGEAQRFQSIWSMRVLIGVGWHVTSTNRQ